MPVPPRVIYLFDVDKNLVTNSITANSHTACLNTNLIMTKNYFFGLGKNPQEELVVLFTKYNAKTIGTTYGDVCNNPQNAIAYRTVLCNILQRQYGIKVSKVLTHRDIHYEQLINNRNYFKDYLAAYEKDLDILRQYQREFQALNPSKQDQQKSLTTVQPESVATVQKIRQRYPLAQIKTAFRGSVEQYVAQAIKVFEANLAKWRAIDFEAAILAGTPQTFTIGSYYNCILKPLEEEFRCNSSLEYQGSENYRHLTAVEGLWDEIIQQQEPDFFSSEPNAKNSKYWMFRRFIQSLGEDNPETAGVDSLRKGINYIKNNKIVLVYSDDMQNFIDGVKKAATELTLEGHLITIFTGNTERVSGIPKDPVMEREEVYEERLTPDLAKIYSFGLLPISITSIISRQNYLVSSITKLNQYDQAFFLLNYYALKRLGHKAINRYNGIFKHPSTTFATELGNQPCYTWALKFLKLAWLFRGDYWHDIAKPKPTLEKELSIDRLEEIYNIQKILSKNKARLLHDWDDGMQLTAQHGKTSPWMPFLNLADNIDDFILRKEGDGRGHSMVNGHDVEALFRLALYYAVIDGANAAFNQPGNAHIITPCLERCKFLLQQQRPSAVGKEALKLQKRIDGITKLQADILRSNPQKPGWLAKKLLGKHTFYAYYGEREETDRQAFRGVNSGIMGFSSKPTTVVAGSAVVSDQAAAQRTTAWADNGVTYAPPQGVGYGPDLCLADDPMLQGGHVSPRIAAGFGSVHSTPQRSPANSHPGSRQGAGQQPRGFVPISEGLEFYEEV